MGDETFLVTGGTGKTGQRVVRVLRERGVVARAASRSGEVRFDWADRATWEPALHGVAGVYVVTPGTGGPEEADVIAAFVRQAAAAGVRRAVLVSVPGGEFDGQERAVRESGLEWTVLRLRWFFQNFSEDFLRDPVLSGEVRLPAGDGLEAFVDAEDIAEVAVAALTQQHHGGQVYELSGPRLMSFGDAVAEIAAATGRDIRYVALSPEEFAAEQRAQGVPKEWIEQSIGLYASVRSGALSTLTDDISKVLGRPARDFADYAKTATAQGAWNL